MTVLVADTSALVSLGVAAGVDPDPLAACLGEYEVLVPEVVRRELDEVAAYDDEHGRGAAVVRDRADDLSVRSVALDEAFPLDDGENGVVSLANEADAQVALCDEFERLGLVHASLRDTRLVTTPTLLAVFVRRGVVSATEATAILDEIAAVRSWDENSYVQRARSLFDE